VVVYSDDNVASLGPPLQGFPAGVTRGAIEIDKGHVQGTVDIDTKSVAPGHSKTATISALYGNVKRQQLEIANPNAP
jgi:hypothetical protein